MRTIFINFRIKGNSGEGVGMRYQLCFLKFLHIFEENMRQCQQLKSGRSQVCPWYVWSVLCICGFCLCGFNQPQIKNIWKKWVWTEQVQTFPRYSLRSAVQQPLMWHRQCIRNSQQSGDGSEYMRACAQVLCNSTPRHGGTGVTTGCGILRGSWANPPQAPRDDTIIFCHLKHLSTT